MTLERSPNLRCLSCTNPDYGVNTNELVESIKTLISRFHWINHLFYRYIQAILPIFVHVMNRLPRLEEFYMSWVSQRKRISTIVHRWFYTGASFKVIYKMIKTEGVRKSKNVRSGWLKKISSSKNWTEWLFLDLIDWIFIIKHRHLVERNGCLQSVDEFLQTSIQNFLFGEILWQSSISWSYSIIDQYLLGWKLGKDNFH